MMFFNYSERLFFPCNDLMDSKTAARIARYTDILAILSMVSPLLSIMGAGSVIIFVSYRRICRSPDINSLFHLSIADILLAIFWIAGPIIHFKYHMQIASDKDLANFCVTLQALCEMVHIISFFLTINYAFNVFLRMKEKKDRLYGNSMDDDIMASQQRATYTGKMKTAGYVFSWLVPVALVLPLLIMVLNEDYFCQMCVILLDAPLPLSHSNKLKNYNGFVLMLITLGFSMVLIIILYVCTLKMYKKTLLGFRTNRERVVVHAMAKRATAYIVVFLYCWTPALILSALGLRHAYEKNPRSRFPLIDQYFPLFVIQTLSAPLQGFLNSLVYGWSRRTFREAVARETRQLNYGSVDSLSTSLIASTEILNARGEKPH